MKLTDLIAKISAETMQVRRTTPRARIESAASAAPPAADRVEISAGSRDVQKMAEILQTVPEIRTEKVTAFKDQIDRGEYRVDSLQLADKLLSNLLTDDLLNG